MMEPADRNLVIYSEPLLAWYKAHRRDLPWRRSRDPYHIWISEVMLQQTRVDTVIPYYHRFLEKFPTLEALADAPEEDVLKQWEGLGYYSRARNLQAAVREVKEGYGGTVPDTLEAVSSLKGVGPYTAGAILSIAYNRPEPAVDGNVMRVLSRFFLLQDDIAKPSTRVRIEALAKSLIPEGEARDFNQALMELGATVCTPKSPSCLTCPVMEHCAARLEGMTEALPVKAKAKPPRPEARLVAFVEGTGAHSGRFLIRQRPQDGLLARMWELPHVAGVQAPAALAAAGGPAAGGAGKRRRRSSAAADAGAGTGADALAAGGGELALFAPLGAEAPAGAPPARRDAELLRGELAERLGLRVEPGEWLMAAEHTFSHIQWQLDVYRCRFEGFVEGGERVGDTEASHWQWIDASDMDRFAFPNVFLRIIRELQPK
ncbi:A/G-specific adenine glycosylase [Paenibacillus sp. HJGM_3]|uniref:A/G-specific adenine glycosylase n=1 Tax=Paenibacillus sp. HJGM_3 TaxID=3379816 RepID=UPI00385E1ACD